MKIKRYWAMTQSHGDICVLADCIPRAHSKITNIVGQEHFIIWRENVDLFETVKWYLRRIYANT